MIQNMNQYLISKINLITNLFSKYLPPALFYRFVEIAMKFISKNTVEIFKPALTLFPVQLRRNSN